MAKDKIISKDAIIFVPGLGREIVDQRIDTVARRLTGALERQTLSAKPKFQVIGAPEEQYGQVYTTPVRTIAVQKSDKEKARPLADLYELDYRETITKRFKDRNSLSKAIVMLWVLLAVCPRFLLSLTKKSKNLKDKIQVLFIAGIIGAIVAYMAIIVSAGVLTLLDTPEIKEDAMGQIKMIVQKVGANMNARQNAEKSQDTGGNKTTAESGDGVINNKGTESKAKLNLIQGLVLIIMSLGLFKKKSFKETVSTIATEFVCASNYLRLASQKTAILGQAAALLEHIAEKNDDYGSVHLVAFSFGTLVSLDLLFPHSRPGARLSTVKNFVTIGCPFDIVRTYWPNYFKNRQRQSNAPEQWVNLYAPLDIFGSNFRDDAKTDAADQGIVLGSDTSVHIMPTSNISYRVGMQTEQLSLFDILTVKGAEIHSLYWSGSNVPELSCFDDVVAKLFGANPILSEAA